MTCPKCSGVMSAHPIADATVHRCRDCGGVFLDRADLASLGEAENDWHSGTLRQTRPMPRITEDMTAPPQAPSRATSSYLEVLFGL